MFLPYVYYKNPLGFELEKGKFSDFCSSLLLFPFTSALDDVSHVADHEPCLQKSMYKDDRTVINIGLTSLWQLSSLCNAQLALWGVCAGLTMSFKT